VNDDDDDDEVGSEDDLDPPEHEDSEPPEQEPSAERRRRRLERVLPEILKRAIEKGLETGIGHLTNSGEALRGVVGDNVKLPREVVSYIFSQVDDTKNAMTRVVAREVREFLSATDLAQELQKALTSLSFEIRTEIRFIPNEAGGLKPEVKAEVEPKRAKSEKPEKKKRSEDS
jgi:hypothetical protein